MRDRTWSLVLPTGSWYVNCLTVGLRVRQMSSKSYLFLTLENESEPFWLRVENLLGPSRSIAFSVKFKSPIIIRGPAESIYSSTLL